MFWNKFASYSARCEVLPSGDSRLEDQAAPIPPRSELHGVTVTEITHVSESIMIIKFDITDINNGIVFPSGKWLDVYFEDLRKAGTYPVLFVAGAATANNTTGPGRPYIEVAARRTQRRLDDTPPVAHTPLLIRVGGTVLWPPTSLSAEPTHNILLVADGLGASPLISMVSRMYETGSMRHMVHFLYTSKVNGNYDVSNVLGLQRLLNLSTQYPGEFHLHLFFSGHPGRILMEGAVPRHRFEPRIVLDSDVIDALSSVDSAGRTLCYVSGPPEMTDRFAPPLREVVGPENTYVLSEKWAAADDFLGMAL